MKVNRDATSFIDDVGWIARYVNVLFFRSKNLNNLCVKSSENKTTICLAHFLFQIIVDSLGICLPMSAFC